MYCTNCGALINDGSLFCTNCGTKIAAAPVEPAAPVAESTAAEPAYTEPVNEVPATEEPVYTESVTQEPVYTEPAPGPAAPPVGETAFKFCTQCGARVSADADFCIVCGSSFNPTAQASDYASGTYNEPPQYNNAQYGPVNRNPYSYRAEDHGRVGAGNAYQYNQPYQSSSSAQTGDLIKLLIKAFMIVGCVTFGWLIIPLFWCIPMTVKAFRCLDSGEPMSLTFKVCSLIFVNLIAGVCMLCINDEGKMII
ncbi:MAG: zinc ribbon domain-containing protein [Clostridia bacterium]|nr:zinc ribbon domain-containing protein [Clostridia bacterium]